MSWEGWFSKAASLLRWPAAVSIGVGCLIIVVYGMVQNNEAEAVAVGLLTGFAAVAVGALVGVVLGIPRRVESSAVAAQRV